MGVMPHFMAETTVPGWRPRLRVFAPTESSELCPGTPTHPTSPTAWKAESRHRRELSPREYERICAEVPESVSKVRIPEAEREDFARSTSLWGFVMQCQAGDWGRIGRKREKTTGTWTGYRDSVRMWCDYMRPTELPDDVGWPGLSLSVLERLSSEQWQEFVDAMDEDVAAPTIGRRWRELKVFLEHAKKINAIRWYCIPELPPEDDLKRVYTPAEVACLWDLLRPHVLLQSAFVVSLNCGLRTNDLMCLPWSSLSVDVAGRPVLDFKARKTGKQQRLPLNATTLAAIERCRPISGHTPWIFFGLTNPEAKFPERTAFALARRGLQRKIWTEANIRDHRKPDEILRKPWQAGRATCSTRYDTFHLGVASFVLGHSLEGVTARSYTEPTEIVWDAVRGVPQYECFRELLAK